MITIGRIGELRRALQITLRQIWPESTWLFWHETRPFRHSRGLFEMHQNAAAIPRAFAAPQANISMPSLQTLLLFIVASCGLLLSPGPNMALVVSQGLAYGPRGGVAVAFGIVIADLVLTLLVVAGVAAMLAAWPNSFDVLRYAGAAYLMWLARQAVRRRRGGGLPAAKPRSTREIVQISVLTSLLNPKALVFFLLFLPQFVDPARGQVSLQLTVLGLVLTATAFAFHAGLGVLSAKARGLASGRSASVVWLDRLQAAVFLGIAFRLLLIQSSPGN